MARLFMCLACIVVFLGGVSTAVGGPLGNAAKAGDVAEMERLLNEGADANESGIARPLFYAIQSNHTDAARLLIERGADVNKASPWGTPIHEAAKRGNAEIVGLLLEQGADLSVTASRGMTPLHAASEGGSIEAVQVLLDHGADAYALTSLDEPAIHYARLNGHEDVAQLLIEHGWAPPEVAPVSDLLASADVEKGEVLAGGCASGCHAFEKGKNSSGPSLWNIVGRPKGSLSSFSYSQTLAAQEGTWTYEDLNAFIAHPAQTIPGAGMMDFRGLPDVQDRADVIAYLRTLSDDPVPLP